jgi:hypothetical protein
MRKQFALLTISFVLACSVVACSAAASSTPSTSPLTKTRDGLTVSLDIKPTPLKVGVPTQLMVTIHDDQNQPVNDASVRMSLLMLGMSMPKNEPTVTAAGNGVYISTGTFTMGGNTWAVDLFVTRGDKTTELLFSSLDVKE